MEKLHKVGSTVTERAREVAKGLQQSGFMRSSIYVHECADALEAKDAEIARLQASDDALGKIHQICHDAGIAEGHAVERVRTLAADLAALRAKPGEVAITDHDWKCRHGTPSRMVLFTTCKQCRNG